MGANTLVAVYTNAGGFTTDLTVAAPPDLVAPIPQFTLADYVARILSQGTLEFTAGLADASDFFVARAADADAAAGVATSNRGPDSSSGFNG